jgi:hypothetical protein
VDYSIAMKTPVIDAEAGPAEDEGSSEDNE